MITCVTLAFIAFLFCAREDFAYDQHQQKKLREKQ